MLQFIARRVLTMIPQLFAVSVIVFLLVHLMPGDPAQTIGGITATPEQLAAIRHQLGLDLPIQVQYWHWLSGVLTGNFGQSLFNSVTVASSIASRLPVTLSLTVLAGLISLVLGLVLGGLAAMRPGRVVDRLVTIGTSVGIAIPPFWLGLIFVSVLALELHLLPATGYERLEINPLEWLRHMILPAFALGVPGSSIIARQARGAFAQVLQSDYIRTAVAKGLPARKIVAKHALKNAAIPVVTVFGIQLVNLLGGALVVEQVFGLQGLGSLAIQAVEFRDIPVIQGFVLFTTVTVIIINLLVDISYAYLNPKVRIA